MLRIRLARVGKKKRPSYRIVVAEAKAPRDGSYLEWIGTYDPMQNPRQSLSSRTGRSTGCAWEPRLRNRYNAFWIRMA